MTWKSLRLFSLEGDVLEPDSVRRRLEGLHFDGEKGIKEFAVEEDFNEMRIKFLFRRPRYMKIARLEGDELHEEKIEVETLVPVEIHLKPDGLVEAYGSSAFVKRALEDLSVLGDFSPVVFEQKDFRRVMDMSDDIRKVRVYETEDEHVVEVALYGGGLSASRELQGYLKSGKLRRISGKIDLPGDRYGFAMDEKSIRFYMKDPEVSQRDVEEFIDSLLS